MRQKTKKEKQDLYLSALKGIINLMNDADFEAFVEMVREMERDVDSSYATAIGEQTHKMQGRKQALATILEMIETAPELLADLELKRSQRKEEIRNGVYSHFT